MRVGRRAARWHSDEVEEWLASRPHTVPESPGRAKGATLDALEEEKRVAAEAVARALREEAK